MACVQDRMANAGCMRKRGKLLIVQEWFDGEKELWNNGIRTKGVFNDIRAEKSNRVSVREQISQRTGSGY